MLWSPSSWPDSQLPFVTLLPFTEKTLKRVVCDDCLQFISSPFSWTHLHLGNYPSPPSKLPFVKVTNNIHVAKSNHQFSYLIDPSVALTLPPPWHLPDTTVFYFTTSLAIPYHSLCWLPLNFPISKNQGWHLSTHTLPSLYPPPLMTSPVSSPHIPVHLYSRHSNLYPQPNLSSTPQTQKVNSLFNVSTCTCNKLLNVTCPKQNSSSSLTNLFLTLSSPSQVNSNFILTAQAKNLESLISVFLPCHILTISKCCQLYLQCTSRIRLHHMTSTATHMNQTTITSRLDIVIDSYVGSGPCSCILTVCSQTVARVTWKNLSQNISLLCPSKDFRFHSE